MSIIFGECEIHFPMSCHLRSKKKNNQNQSRTLLSKIRTRFSCADKITSHKVDGWCCQVAVALLKDGLSLLRVGARQYRSNRTGRNSTLQDAQLLTMHPLDVPCHVHLLLRAVVTVRALELWLLATLPLLMIPQ